MSYRREFGEKVDIPIIKGGDVYRRKYKTKSQLVAQFYRKEGDMSPKIDTVVREGADDVKLDIPYQITNVEDLTTDVQQFTGQRVTLIGAKGEEGNVVLWQRKITGMTSKLGVFITILGDDTDKWLHKWIVFRQWSPRNRVIEVISAPVPKASKGSAKKTT